VIDVFIDAETASRQWNVARIVPIRYENVVIRQHGSHGCAQ
jgi:hypothetical protein